MRPNSQLPTTTGKTKDQTFQQNPDDKIATQPSLNPQPAPANAHSAGTWHKGPASCAAPPLESLWRAQVGMQTAKPQRVLQRTWHSILGSRSEAAPQTHLQCAPGDSILGQQSFHACMLFCCHARGSVSQGASWPHCPNDGEAFAATIISRS